MNAFSTSATDPLRQLRGGDVAGRKEHAIRKVLWQSHQTWSLRTSEAEHLRATSPANCSFVCSA